MGKDTKLLKLSQSVKGIPSVEFYQLEEELYYRKENIITLRDARRLEEQTARCINWARRDGNRNLELILKWHQIENDFCRVEMRDSDINPDDIKNRIRCKLTELIKQAIAAIRDLTDNENYPKHVTLCRLFSCIACGFVTLGDFDKATEMLSKCKEKDWVRDAASTRTYGDRLQREHIGMYFYASGRCNLYHMTSQAVQGSELCKELKRDAIHNITKCQKEYKQIFDSNNYHVYEIAISNLHMTRVYLHLQSQANDTTPDASDVMHANQYLVEAMRSYQKYEEITKRRTIRLEIRIDWQRSSLLYRTYQLLAITQNAPGSTTAQRVLLEQAEFYCQRCIDRMEKAGYVEKPELEELHEEIVAKINSIDQLYRPVRTDAMHQSNYDSDVTHGVFSRIVSFIWNVIVQAFQQVRRGGINASLSTASHPETDIDLKYDDDVATASLSHQLHLKSSHGAGSIKTDPGELSSLGNDAESTVETQSTNSTAI